VLATCSPEGKISTALHELMLREPKFAARNLVDLGKLFSIQISHGTFSEALNGKTRLNSQTAERLLELINELKQLREKFEDVPINWAATERVSGLILLQRVQRISSEVGQQQIAVAK
jgi:hypothetical protein